MRLTVTRLNCLLTTAGLLFWSGISLAADDAPKGNQVTDIPPTMTAEEEQFFENKIRPVLVKHCYECHSDSALKANRLKGGLHVDSREGLRRGGDSGPAIVPKDREKSLLLRALKYESLQMPPQGKLSAEVIADFEHWIALGAVDPRVENSKSAARNQLDLEAGRRHWSYRPLRNGNIPDVRELSFEARSPLDAFVLARLQAESIAAAALSRLARDGKFDPKKAVKGIADLGVDPEKVDPARA